MTKNKPFPYYILTILFFVLGLFMGWIYRPRTWCTICPVSTLSNMALASQKSSKRSQPVVRSEAAGSRES